MSESTDLLGIRTSIDAAAPTGHRDIDQWRTAARSAVTTALQNGPESLSDDRPQIERLIADRPSWEQELTSHPSVRLVRSHDWRSIPDPDFIRTPANPSSQAFSDIASTTRTSLATLTDRRWRNTELLNYIADCAWLVSRIIGIRAGLNESYGR